MQVQPGSITTEKHYFRGKEIQLRANLQKLLVAIFIFIASLLLLLMVPFFPYTVSILGAAGLAALAFEAPAPAIGLMLLASLPGYIYQLGLPVPVFAGMGFFFLMLFLFCNKPGTAMGTAAGVIAAMLMLTPIYYLSLPVFMGITIFRARGQKVGSTSSLFVFLVLFLPLLTANLSISLAESNVPLFEQTSHNMQQPLSFVEIGSMVSALDKQVNTNTNILPNLAVYLPIGYTDYGSRLLGIILVALIAVGLSIAFGVLFLFNWLIKRETGIRYLRLMAPIVSLIVANIAFLLLLNTLNASFRYTVALDAVSITGMLLGTVFVGAIGSASEQWLRHRDHLISLREELSAFLPNIVENNNLLKARVESTKAVCPSLDLNFEEAILAKCSQELSFVSSVEFLETNILEQKLKLFKDLEVQLNKAFQESRRKLTQYYNEGRMRFNDYLRHSDELGLLLGDSVESLTVIQATFSGYDELLKEQKKINERLSQLAQILMSQCDRFFKIITAEIDNTIMRGGVEISRNYLNQGNYEDATDTLLTILEAAERNTRLPIAELSSRISADCVKLKNMLLNKVLPMLDILGDEKSITLLNNIISQLDSLHYAGDKEKTFAIMVRIVDQGTQLTELSHTVISWVLTKIGDLEKEIEAKVPRGYAWGRESNILSETEDLVNQLKTKLGKQNLETRIAIVENINRDVENKAVIISQYASTLEFLINYINIEYLLDRILQEKSRVQARDLPVRSNYALRYLKLYSEKRYSDVIFDSTAEILRPRAENER